MAELHLLVDGVVVKKFPLNKTVVTIGRLPISDIVIDDDSVSGEHARIELIPNELMDGLMDIFIKDLGSTNGTFVNDKQVNRQQLQNSDYIRIAWTDFKLASDKGGQIARTSVMVQ